MRRISDLYSSNFFVSNSLRVLLLIALLMTALTSLAAPLPIQYELVARSGDTAIPEGVGAFNGFSEAPAVDSDGNIAFVAAGGSDGISSFQSGIYTFIGGQLQKVADKNTLVPDGGGAKFRVFYGSDLNDIDAGRVAFRANTVAVGTVLGLYTNVGQPAPNNLVELAIVDGNEWSESGYPWVDDGKVAMRGKLPSGQTEILLWDSFDLSMNFIDPGTGYIVSPANQPSISGDATMYRRYKSGSSQMVIDNAGSIEVLATIGSTPLPGQPGLVFSNFNYYPALDRGGLDAAFQATGGAIRGVYKRVNGGALQAVADTTTVVPGTASNIFYWFDEAGISMANGQTAFSADGQNFLNGIYTDIGGDLSVIVDDQDNNTINIDGQLEQVSDIRFGSKSFAYTPDGYIVVFRAALQSGGTAIIRATISFANPIPSDVIFSGGFEY